MFRVPRCLLTVLRTLALALGLGSAVLAHAGVVVIAHPSVRKLDLQTVQRIYTGRMIEVDGVPVVPLHVPTGLAQRQRFLADYLQQTEDAYTAYWTVRRYVGKGVPPREVWPLAHLLATVAGTPGAIAYVDEADVPAGVGVHIVLRR